MPAAAGAPAHGWWQGAVGYEVYVRSFQDSNGDGVGDLPGVRARLPYLAELGVDVVWLTPFYPSPQADHGYDVSDYLAVDPMFGRLADVDALVADAHALGLRILVDLVPNHTSDRHPWFVDARSGRTAEHRNWYVWRDPAPGGGPPNNWVSHFGGPAWSFDAASGQWYMHLFLPEQPDLNWGEPAVADAFDRILEFWLARGVDGFRVDVAHALVEDVEYRDNPLVADPPPPGASPRDVFAAYDHRYDQDQEGVLDIFRRWNRVVGRHDALLLGEVYLLEPARLTRYVDDASGLHRAFCFAALRTRWDAADIRGTLATAVVAGGGALAWPLSSHDDPRAATRFGGGERGARRALAYLTLLGSLPGMPFLFQGDELGLDDGAIDLAADPMARRNAGTGGRDGSRTPMLWQAGDGYGFTTGRPWLPFGANRHDGQTVAAQRADRGSHLERVRALLAARRRLQPLRDDTPVDWLDAGADVVALRRGDVLAACNCGDQAVVVPLGGGGTLAYASGDGVNAARDHLRLAADTAALVRLA